MTGWLSRYSSDGDQANTEALRISKPEDKGLFEGGLKATGEGIARGGVALGRAGQLAGSLIPLFQDELWGLDPNAEGSAYREYMDVTDPVLKTAEDAYQVDENAGTGAQVLGGLGRIVLPLMAGGGNPTPLIASETTIGAQDALKQGATSEQAVGIGVAQGAVAGLGFKIPAAIGNNAATKIASGAAINVGLGAGLRGVQGAIAGDNEKLAEMYDPFDPTYVVTDLAIGATFGAIAAIAGKRRAAPLDQQDVIADAEIQQQTQASSPVTPDSPNVANRHVQNLDAAEQALNTGQPVNAKPIIRPVKPSADIELMPINDRKKLKYNSPLLDAYAANIEIKYGLPDGVLVAIKNSGERSNSDQVSPAGAQGVMQFIPSTWAAYGKGLDPTDPVHSIDAAGRFWSDLIKQYDGNVLAAAAHYNGGTKQGKLVASGKRPSNAETAGYVDRIERHLGAMGKDVPMPPRVDEPIVTDGEPPLVQTTPDTIQLTPDLFGSQQPQVDAQPIIQPDVAPLDILQPVAVEDVGIGGASPRFNDLVATPALDAIAAGNYAESGNVKMVVLQDAYDGGTVVAVDAKNKVVGTLDYVRTEDENGMRYNPTVYVDKSYRRQGIASAMYQIAERHGGAKIPKIDQEGQVRTEDGQAFREGMQAKAAAGKMPEIKYPSKPTPHPDLYISPAPIAEADVLAQGFTQVPIKSQDKRRYVQELDQGSRSIIYRGDGSVEQDYTTTKYTGGMIDGEPVTVEIIRDNSTGKTSETQIIHPDGFKNRLDGGLPVNDAKVLQNLGLDIVPSINNIQKPRKPDSASNSTATPEQQAALGVPDDLRIPTGELDADGNPITMTAKEMREQLAAEKAAIDEQTKANDAAITCALGFGE